MVFGTKTGYPALVKAESGKEKENMGYIAKRAQTGLSASDILKTAAEAKADRQKGNKVIDASIGVFLYDEKKLGEVGVVKDAIAGHVTDDLSYPPVSGPESYKVQVQKWLFKDHYEEVRNRFHIAFGATLGGTGAICLAFNTFLERGDAVLLPSMMWTNYVQIAEKAGLFPETYPLFNSEDGFNTAGLKNQIEELSQKQKNVLVLINDPCQNPTGYCLKDGEYGPLFDMLDEEGKKTNLTVIFDIAYIDYDERSRSFHPLFRSATGKIHSFLPAFAFSCSKSFGLYGMRCGALFALCPDEETEKGLIGSIECLARSIYSCPNGPALLSVAKALEDESSRQKLEEEICSNEAILNRRAKLIRKELSEKGIAYLPFTEGFFITVVVKDAYRTSEELKKRHMYVVILDANHIRIALSGLNEEEIPVLVSALKEAM